MAKRTTKTPAPADLPTNGTAKSRSTKTAAKTSTAKIAVPRAPKAKGRDDVALPAAHEVAMRAYFRYLERGGGHGRSMDDWLAAEAELRAERASVAAKSPAARKRGERATRIEPDPAS